MSASEPEKREKKPEKAERVGFKPFVDGLDTLIQGGVPKGSWLSIYGPSGSMKTLHSLAFCLNAVNRGERCVYVSTEMYHGQIKSQIASLGWDEYLKNVHQTLFTTKIISDEEYGNYELVWVDIDSLYYWAWKLNAIVREEGRKGERKTYWYSDINLLAHVIITALGAVGVVKREKEDITLQEIDYSRLRDGLFEKESKYRYFTVSRDVSARVIVDSFSPYVEARGYNKAGTIATWMKMRLAIPNVTYVLVNHVSKTTEEELGAAIAHVVDGRIKLFTSEEKDHVGVKGVIMKMRETNHSRRVHSVVAEEQKMTVIKWVP